jgi:putative hemolysin
MELTTQYIVLIACLFLSGFFSSAETAFVGLTRVKIHEFMEKRVKNAEGLLRLKKNSHKVIITILIGNNLVNILASAVATTIAIKLFGSDGVGIAVGVMTFLILILGEIIPKSYAANNAAKISLHNVKVLSFLMWILTPFIWFFENLNKAAFKMFGSSSEPGKITEEDIINTIALSEADGTIKAQERELLHNVFEFDDTTVEDIMTPREQVFTLDIKTSFRDALDKMIEEGYSRVPVYADTPEKIAGVLHIKDAFKALADGKSLKTLKTLVESAFFVPETNKINTLLRTFQKKKIHMAVAINEYGGFVGVVTMEDLLEELVGEIYDEFDKEEIDIKKVTEKEFIVKGDCNIDVFNKGVADTLPESDAYNTVAGYLMKMLGRLPKKGDKIIRDSFMLIVTRASDTRVHAVKVKLK